MPPSWFGQFSELTAKKHSDQAKWWLNGFWNEGAEAEADRIWDITHSFIELDVGHPILYGRRMKEYTESSDLGEIASHQILEKIGETKTIIELRKQLKDIDLDSNNRMALAEYLLFAYKKKPEALVNSPQGDVDPAKLAAAEEAFEKAGEALDQAASDKEAAAAALKAANSAAARAHNALEAATAAAGEAASALKVSEAAAAAAAAILREQEAAEAEVRAAEAELQAVIDDITAQEQAKIDKIASLQKIVDSPGGAVKKGKASNEIQQIQSEDSMPLRKAKITQNAVMKKVAKQRALAEAATAKAAASKRVADDAQAASDQAKREADAAETAAAKAKQEADAAAALADAAKAKADAAVLEAEAAVREAEAQLAKVKESKSVPYGHIYWMERTLKEKKKFM